MYQFMLIKNNLEYLQNEQTIINKYFFYYNVIVIV